jgi:beta-ureidopropionase
LNGAEIVYNPSATTVGQSQYLWKLEQPAHAVANGYFMGCINRVGTEAPWNLGKFYGTSYFVNPLGEIFATASEDKDELLVANLISILLNRSGANGSSSAIADRKPMVKDYFEL